MFSTLARVADSIVLVGAFFSANFLLGGEYGHAGIPVSMGESSQ